MSDEEIKAFVAAAVQQLVREQPDLLELDVNEQTVAHQLSYLLAPIVPIGSRIDVEYDRHGPSRKQVLLDHEGERRERVIRPDIIIHRRGTDEANLLAIELKKPGARLDHDRVKLQALRTQYGYRLAAHILIGVRDGSVVNEVIWVD